MIGIENSLDLLEHPSTDYSMAPELIGLWSSTFTTDLTIEMVAFLSAMVPLSGLCKAFTGLE